jgi:diguanylate cyclase (GGDEF)-like protein/PAS domain S-box-containing protein
MKGFDACAQMRRRIKVSPMSADLSPKQMLELVLNALPVALFWKDRDSRILGCNQKFADDSGVVRPADLVGKTNFDFYPIDEAEAYRADDLDVINTGLPKLGIEEPLLLPNGETAWVETNKIPIRNSLGAIVGLLGTYRDITERRRLNDERIRFALELAIARQAATLAMHDALTELPNRRYLKERLGTRLLDEQSNEALAVVALDLDRFKAINDLYGHAVGDELLQKVARILTAAVGAEGFVARVGGDEFILLLGYETDASLAAQLSALVVRFDRPLSLTAHEVSVGITLGAAISPADGTDPDLLMRRADIALYQAKVQGRSRFAFFEPAMESVQRDRMLLEHDLRTAVQNDRIIPYFQPIIELGTNRVSCYEILARWPHAERGLVHPGQFIEVAQSIGLINELTANLLRRACHEASTWSDSTRLSINISPMQLRDVALPQMLLKVLLECGFPPARIEIEITEDAIIADFETALITLTSLKNLGIRVALDDFGTGYSSLQSLRKLPFDILKIDKSFVQSMKDGNDALVIIKAIVQLAKNLGLSVTAEGIETESQLLTLEALGCDRGQGFFLGIPRAGPLIANENSLGRMPKIRRSRRL